MYKEVHFLPCLRLIFSRSSHPTCLFSKGTVFPIPIVSEKASGAVFLFNKQFSLADCRYLCTINTIQRYTYIGTALFRASLSLRYLSAEITAERCTAKTIFINCFCSLSITVRNTTAMDVGGSKQYHVLPSAKHDIKSVQGCTGLITAPKNRVCVTRAAKRIFASIAAPKYYRPSFCLFLTYGRNSFCEKR